MQHRDKSSPLLYALSTLLYNPKPLFNPPFFRSVILYDSMFSASVSFPNKKDMDAFIAAFTRAKASLSPLSAAAAGGLPVSEGAAGGANAAM